MNGLSTDLGLKAARTILELNEHDWPLYVERLRRNKELSIVARQLNELLEHPEHRDLAVAAFKRIGLWHE